MLGKFHFKFEPAAWSEVVRQAMYLGLIFEIVKWTETQQVAVMMFVSALLALITRSFTTPTATVTNTPPPPSNGGTRLGSFLLLAVLCISGMGASCNPKQAPPNLTPEAVVAFQNTQVLKNLDLVRDMAISAENAGLLSRNTTRQVVLWHRASISLLHARSAGWQDKIVDGVRAMQSANSALTDGEKDVLAPYFGLIKTSIFGDK